MDAEKKIESPSPEEQKHLAAIDVPEIDHVAEAKLVRKLDLNIVWVVMALYLFSFLDRQVTSFGSLRKWMLEFLIQLPYVARYNRRD